MSVVLQFVKELGPVKLLVAGFLALFFILFFGIFVYRISSSEKVILYSDLDLTDSNKIVQELENRGIDYELAAGGTVIKVPKNEVLRLRIAMAQDGIPGKGSIIGFEIFDKEESMGSTSFLQNVKMLRALEGELTRTIENLEQVDRARVHLVIPRKELFSKERQEPRASVVLKLKSSINKQEIDSVSHLVASAVPELETKNITIIDSKGRSLKLSHKDGDEGYSSSINIDRKLSLENNLKNTIEELLERSLGPGKVKAQVNLDMDFDRVVSNSEIYDPDGAVLRSSQTSEEKEKTPTGSEDSVDVSVANNIPGGGSFASSDSGFATITKTDETKNYEISKTVTSQIKESGDIKKLFVAVMIDGTYAVDPVTDKEIYTPRSQEEISKIENIVKVAVGFDASRNDQVQVINMQFAKSEEIFEEDSMSGWIRNELPGMIQTIVVSMVVLGIFVTVVRPVAMRAFDIQKADLKIDPKNPDPFEKLSDTEEKDSHVQDVMLNISKKITISPAVVSVSKINESFEQYPQETVMIIRRWLNEEN
ncbi:MAG: flagellar basal-body MS-ring/collar protein FliF [Rickettsiaceae bacterium]|nr:flagellar basal-body MS-ring/collar protein FliF [Rickettsiaceae bacterium]